MRLRQANNTINLPPVRANCAGTGRTETHAHGPGDRVLSGASALRRASAKAPGQRRHFLPSHERTGSSGAREDCSKRGKVRACFLNVARCKGISNDSQNQSRNGTDFNELWQMTERTLSEGAKAVVRRNTEEVQGKGRQREPGTNRHLNVSQSMKPCNSSVRSVHYAKCQSSLPLTMTRQSRTPIWRMQVLTRKSVIYNKRARNSCRQQLSN